MAQIFSFQRSDTIPRNPQGYQQQNNLQESQPAYYKQPEPDNQSFSAPAGSTMNRWGIHGHTGEQLNDFRASNNALINLAAELLALLVTLPHQQKPGNLPEFRENLVDRVSAVNNRGRMQGHSQSLMDRCCYVLCAALDEGINSTEWGRKDGWENHSLLSRLFQQRNGGEVFFVLLEQAQQHPEQQFELLELMYILLRMGFQGRYQKLEQHGREGHKLTRLSAELYSDLRRIRPSPKESQQPPSIRVWHPLRQFSRGLWLSLIPVLLLAGYITTAFWIDNSNQARIHGLENLQQWVAPEESSIGVIYNSTEADMELWPQ